MSTKSKILRQTSFTAVERDERLSHYLAEGFRMMHVSRHSGSPDYGLLIGRSVFSILVTMVHNRLATNSFHGGRSLSQMLEDLKSEQITDEVTHLGLRRAAAALGDFGIGRDLQDVMAACEVLQQIVKSEAYKKADGERRAIKARKATDRRRPAVVRWASAAAGLFSVSS